MNCIKDGRYTGDSCFGCKIKVDDCEIRDKVYRNRWIPVSERLPDAYQLVLATYEDKRIEIAFIHLGGVWSGCFWGEVIAWQPLPEPYKAVEE